MKSQDGIESFVTWFKGNWIPGGYEIDILGVNAEVINPRLGSKSSDELRPGVCDINSAVLMSQRALIRGGKMFWLYFYVKVNERSKVER